MSVVDPVTATRRAVLADVCRGRPRRPLSLLRPRFVRRGVVGVGVVVAPPPPPNAPPPQSPLLPAVLFDEVAFDVACESDRDGGPPQHLRTVPMWVARPAMAVTAATQGAEGPPRPPSPPLPPMPPPLLPAVLWLHGKTKSRDHYLPVAESLARRGCIVAVPDMPYHGGRRRPTLQRGAPASAPGAASASASAFAADEFEEAVADAVRSGEAGPLVLDWAWDALCALDALQALYGSGQDDSGKEAAAEGGFGGGSGDEHSRLLTRAEVRAYRNASGGADCVAPRDVALDPARVALAGVSMGGSAALLVSVVAADGPGSEGRCSPPKRVAACAPFIALQYWRWGLDYGDAWLGRAESLAPAFAAAIEAAAAGGASERGEGEANAQRPSRRDAWERALRRLLPGLLEHYDAPHALAALRASGVPLLACNSASDPRCPIDGAEEAWREAEEAEAAAAGATAGASAAAAAAAAGGGAAARELFVDPSARGHELTPAMVERFEAWLGEVGL
jgi:alpha-beta hydrolase superfamily lysophospholipase